MTLVSSPAYKVLRGFHFHSHEKKTTEKTENQQLFRSIREVMSQGKSLPPNWSDRRVNTENHNLTGAEPVEHKHPQEPVGR